MRNLKKVLTLVLTVAMLLSVMVVGTGAAFSDQSSIKNTEAVDACVALNIIGGFPDGTYRPTNNVTRAEMCKMICIALNGGKEPNLGTNNTPTFSDVRGTSGAWAEAYIESCNSLGIVSGVGGGRFNPNGNITGTQAARMLLVTLGYNATTEQFTGNSWAVNVNIRATQKGLYKGIESIDTNAALTRDNAAQMIKNALDANMVTYKNEFTTGANGQIVATPVLADKEGVNGSRITLLLDKYEALTQEARLTAFNYNSNKGEWTYTIGATAGSATAPVVVSTTDYTSLLGQKVQAVYTYDNVKKQNTAYGIFPVDSKVVLTGTVGDLPNFRSSNSSDTSFKMNNETYRLDGSMTLNTVPVYAFNGSNYNTPYSAATLYALAGNGETADDARQFSAVDYDGNGKIDFFSIVPFTVEKITYVNSTEFRTNAPSNNRFTISDVNAYDGIAKGDYVVHVAAANTADKTDAFTKAESLSGKITSTDKPSAMVDGNWYTFDKSYTSAKIDSDCKPGTTLSKAVLVNGYIFDADATNTKAITDYVLAVSKSSDSFGQNQVKLLFADGKKEVVNLASTSATPGAGDIGSLYTYTKNGDGDYILAAASDTGTGFDVTAKATLDVKKASNSSSKAGYITATGKDSDGSAITATTSIADDTVVFIKYSSNSYKVITGEQMKKMSASDFDDSFTGYLLATKSGNTYEADMAYVSVGTKAVNDADTYYGYVTSVNEVQNDDNQTVKSVTVWTKDGEKTYLTAATNITNGNQISKRNAIEFKLNSDNEISEVVAGWNVGAGKTVTDASSTADGYATVAISSMTSSLQFQLKDNSTVISQTTNGKFYEMTNDTVYLYIENTDAVGQEKVDISTADDATTANQLVPNAFIVFNTDGDILLMIYDVDNAIEQ